MLEKLGEVRRIIYESESPFSQYVVNVNLYSTIHVTAIGDTHTDTRSRSLESIHRHIYLLQYLF